MTTRQKISAEQWEEIKSTFLHLYIDENKSLTEVRRELEERYNFKASRSAYTRQIESWNAKKNYTYLDKQQLALQQVSGLRPRIDNKGRPPKWDRVYRATKGRKALTGYQNSRGKRGHFAAHRRPLDLESKVPSPIADCDSRVIGLAADIWRQSTLQFASQDPSTKSYHMKFSLYHQLMQSMSIITMSSQWPQREVEHLCNSIPALIREQPAMACEVLIFLTKQETSESFEGLALLREHLFNYIRSMSCVVLPEHNQLRQLLCCLDSRQALTALGAAIAKVKLDTMWNTEVNQTGQAHHQRLFFRQVLMNAILVVMDYGDVEYASKFLRRMSDSDSQSSADLAVDTTLSEQQIV